MPKRPNPEFGIRNFVSRSWGVDGTSDTSIGRSFHHLDRQYTSLVTPDFWKKKRARQPLPENSYAMSVSRRWATGYSYLNYMTTPFWRNLGGSQGSEMEYWHQTPFYFMPPTMETEAMNKVAQRMAAQMSGVRVNLAQFFGERKQTAHMLADTATRIVEAAKALRRADARAFMRALDLPSSHRVPVNKGFIRVAETPITKRIANHWLEYVYGWRPLLSDVFSSAELLAEHSQDPARTTGKVRASATLSRAVVQRDSRNGLTHLLHDYNCSVTIGVKARAFYTLDDSSKVILAQTGISNPLLLAWELLPYSFVVDWFLPVGNYLESLTAFDGFTLTGGSTSILRKAVTTVQGGLYVAPDYRGPSMAYTHGRVIQTDVSMNRNVGTLPSYHPQLRSPIGGAPLERMATAMSLLRQLFGR